jgi:hypothetical protein
MVDGIPTSSSGSSEGDDGWEGLANDSRLSITDICVCECECVFSQS